MTPYHYSLIPNNAEIEETNCVSCQTPTLYLDHSQGDTVCTSCGLVHSQHFKSTAAEWRDYSSFDPDASSARNGPGAIRAGSIVDESRWAGGLEPTALGKVYNPNGAAGCHDAKLEGYRRKLGKMKRVVDRWVEKEFERQVEASKVAIKMREQREKMKSNAGESGKKKYRNKEQESEEDWTGYGTNEHEQIARQRMQETNEANRLLVSEKWSLDRALLLHGEPHEIPAHYTSHNPLRGEKPKDIQKERETIIKRMDMTQKKASADLYCAYKIIQQSLRELDLIENTSFYTEIMKAICKYVDAKGTFKVKGVAPRISNDLKKDTLLHEQQCAYIKQRQMAALASAAIYLECKKDGLGRTVPEICSSFELPANCQIEKFKAEAFIKPKHLSKAINEFKVILPDYIQSISERATAATANGKSSTITSSSTIPLPVTSSSTTSTTTPALRAHTNTTNQIRYFTKKLKLSSTASRAITKLVLHCKDNNSSNHVGPKNTALIASVIYMVCDAATTMQRLSKTAIERKGKKRKEIKTEIKQEINEKIKTGSNTGNGIVEVKKENENEPQHKNDAISTVAQEKEGKSKFSIKRKHIRPGGGRNPKKRRLGSADLIPDVPSSSSLIADDDFLKPLDMTPFEEDEATSKKLLALSAMQSYYEWTLEKSWNRSLTQIAQSCNTSIKSICEIYRKELYPKRKELLNFLQDSRKEMIHVGDCCDNDGVSDSKANVLFSNFASVAPLMFAAKM